MHPVIFRDGVAKKDFFAFSTQKSDKIETVDGKKFFVIQIDVSSASHPFFTGKQNLVDTFGRVEKFKAKMARAEKK